MTSTPPVPTFFSDVGFGDLNQELAVTRKVLERFPDGKGDWTPHEKSRSLGQLAAHTAQLAMLGALILDSDGFDTAGGRRTQYSNSASELLSSFDDVTARLRESMARARQETLDGDWTMRAGDRVLFKLPKRMALRVVFLNHLIHHRAQLGVYYRLLGVPVPIVYGPTADEKM